MTRCKLRYMAKSLLNITSTNIIFIFYFNYKRNPRTKLISTIRERDCSCWQQCQWLEGVRRPCWGHEEWQWPGEDCPGDRSSSQPGTCPPHQYWEWSWRWRESPGPWSRCCQGPTSRCVPTPRTWGWRWWHWWRTPGVRCWTPWRRCRAHRIFWPGGNVRNNLEIGVEGEPTLGTTTTSSTFLLILGTVLTWHSYFPASLAVTYLIWKYPLSALSSNWGGLRALTFRVHRFSRALISEENLESEMNVSWSTVMMWLSAPLIQETDLILKNNSIHRQNSKDDIDVSLIWSIGGS